MRISIYAPIFFTLALIAVAHSALVATNDLDKPSSHFRGGDVHTVTVPPPDARLISKRDTYQTVNFLPQADNNLYDYIYTYPISNSGQFSDIYDLECLAPGNNMPLYTCIYVSIQNVLEVFFDAYADSNFDKRDGAIFVTDYPPVPGCSTRCRLRTEAEEGSFRPIGNITRIVNDTSVVHTIHYMRNGTVEGLRSLNPSASNFTEEDALESRADNFYYGAVGDYAWSYGDPDAYYSFDSYADQISVATTYVMDVLKENNVLVACVSFMTSSESDVSDYSYLDSGTASVGWGNDQYYFVKGVSETIDFCHFLVE